MATTEPSNVNGAAGAIPPTAALAPIHPSSGGDRAIAAFSSQASFEAAQRMAKALASSSLMPTAYQNSIPNCLVAMEMASRIGASVFMVAQNLDVIHGKPSWSSKFLIATVNASGRFTAIRWRWQGTEGKDDWGCRAVAKDRETGEECVGPLVTIKLAKEEGWYAKNGSKWKTLPELMLMYRSAGFWTRVYCPELSLGLNTAEEAIDTVGYTVAETVTRPPQTVSAKSLEDELMGKPATPPVDAEIVNEQTGEVTSQKDGE
jgi:hypothetical protein